MTDLWGPIQASDWRNTPCVVGRPATEDDVAAGNAVFYVPGDSAAASMTLPCCAVQSRGWDRAAGRSGASRDCSARDNSWGTSSVWWQWHLQGHRGSLAPGRFRVVGWRLTIHSSRSRFAARLNSGVSPQTALQRSVGFHAVVARPLRLVFGSRRRICRRASGKFSWSCVAPALHGPRPKRCSAVRDWAWKVRRCAGPVIVVLQGQAVVVHCLRLQLRPNSSFKPNPLRCLAQMCRSFGSITSRSAGCGSA